MEAKGEEVRRIHVVYFLCRMGKAEHPHLIRLHKQNRNGVRLRDVKRWLAEVRGKDMPDSFAWSYRRKYKTGYVWQDLLEDDLITPISDNEYVLKGSEISSSYLDASFSSEHSTPSEKTSFDSSNSTDMPEKFTPEKKAMSAIPAPAGTGLSAFEALEDEKSTGTETDSKVLTKSSPEASQKIVDSSQSSSTSTVSSGDDTQEHKNLTPKKEQAPTLRRSRLRDLLTCRTMDAVDPASVKKAKQTTSGVKKIETLRPEPSTILSQSWSQSHHYSRKNFHKSKGLKKESISVCKTIAKPNCSQCGQRFRPEKLHVHMQSCRGMKSRAKRSKAREAEDASISSGIAQP